jgi:hypothetical protein
VSFNQRNAHICPACISATSSLLFACINKSLHTLSFCHETEFSKESPDFIIPEYTLTKVRVPTKGSVMILNAIAETGSLSSGFLSIIFVRLSGSTHFIDHLSSGLGK